MFWCFGYFFSTLGALASGIVSSTPMHIVSSTPMGIKSSTPMSIVSSTPMHLSLSFSLSLSLSLSLALSLSLSLSLSLFLSLSLSLSLSLFLSLSLSNIPNSLPYKLNRKLKCLVCFGYFFSTLGALALGNVSSTPMHRQQGTSRSQHVSSSHVVN